MADYTMPERAHTALITVDAQRDYVRETSPVKTSGCAQTLPALGELVQGVRALGLPIVHTVRFYRADGSNVDLGRRRMVEEGVRVLMPGSLGAELVEEVRPDGAPRLDPHLLMGGEMQRFSAKEVVFYKPRWGAFFGTGVEQHLQKLGVNSVIICGLNFPTAGRATILEASERDLRVAAVPAAVGGAGEESFDDLARIGLHLMRVEACLNWLRGAPRPDCAA